MDGWVERDVSGIERSGRCQDLKGIGLVLGVRKYLVSSSLTGSLCTILLYMI